MTDVASTSGSAGAPAGSSVGTLDATVPSALAAREVTVRFGGLMALASVSIDVAPGQVAGLVGPNGAGKSTLLSVLSGLRRPNAGTVTVGGVDVTSSSARARARAGLARTFQQPELFLGLTVREHLVLSYRARTKPFRLWGDMLYPSSLFPPTADERARVDELLERLHLTAVAKAPVAALPLGVVRLVEAARALAGDPRVLLLDEPLSGLDVRASENLLDVFGEVVEQSGKQLSIIMVEHDVAAVLSLSDIVFVLDFGELIATGTPDVVRNDPAVRAAYLGDGDQPSRTNSPVAETPAGGDAAADQATQALGPETGAMS